MCLIAVHPKSAETRGQVTLSRLLSPMWVHHAIARMSFPNNDAGSLQPSLSFPLFFVTSAKAQKGLEMTGVPVAMARRLETRRTWLPRTACHTQCDMRAIRELTDLE
jgi:hypothetical protein